MPDTDNVVCLPFETESLKDAINKTSYSVFQGQQAFNFAGIYWIKEIDENGQQVLRLTSTDSSRLNVASIYSESVEAFPLEPQFDKGILVPRKGLLELKNLADTVPVLNLGLTMNNLVAKTDNAVMHIRLLEGLFPDISKVRHQDHDKELTVNRKDFLEVLKRVSILTTQKYNTIYFQFLPGILNLTIVNPELGRADERVVTDYDGPEVTIGFEAKFFIEALSAMKSSRVRLAITDSIKPVVLTGAEDPGYTGIITTLGDDS
jgi:DNA polymerase-3 subunit beta